MEEEKKIIKPPFGFTFQLFILMNIIFLKFILLFRDILHISDDFLFGYRPWLFIISGVCDIFLFTYAFCGVYKALQRKKQSLTILKFSLVYIFLQRFFPLTHLITTNYRYIFSLDTLISLFILYMFVYIVKSRKLKDFLPKKERKFGIAGILGLLIYCMSISMSGNEMYSKYYVAYKSFPTDVSNIKLEEGECSDGSTIFRPALSWTCDTIIKQPESNSFYVFKTNKDEQLLVTTIQKKCVSRIDYYYLLSYCWDNIMGDSIRLYEVCSSDSIINGNRYFSNTYLVGNQDSTNNVTWTFAGLVSNDLFKILTISGFNSKGNKDLSQDIIKVYKSADFHLEKRRVVN